MRWFFVLYGIVYFLFPFSARAGSDCEYNTQHAPKSLLEARQRCHFILSGTIDLAGFKQEKSRRDALANIKVKTVWLGKVEDSYKIEEDKCFELKPGKEYLIFARRAGNNILQLCSYPSLQIEKASALLAELGEGWPADLTTKSSYPNTDGRIQCPTGSTLTRGLYPDKSRIYSCAESKDATKSTPHLLVYDNGNIKEQGAIKNLVRNGEWKFFDRDGKLVATKRYEENGDEVCDNIPSIPPDYILIGYTKGQTLYPLAVWDGTNLKSAAGLSIKNYKSFVSAQDNVSLNILAKPPHRDAHSNQCIYSGTISNKTSDLTLTSSQKLEFFTSIPKAAKDTFDILKGPCVRQGDEVPEKCVFKELIAVSDLNKNGRFEFWFKQPYLWDDAVSVAELSEDSKKLISITTDCSDCSD